MGKGNERVSFTDNPQGTRTSTTYDPASDWTRLERTEHKAARQEQSDSETQKLSEMDKEYKRAILESKHPDHLQEIKDELDGIGREHLKKYERSAKENHWKEQQKIIREYMKTEEGKELREIYKEHFKQSGWDPGHESSYWKNWEFQGALREKKGKEHFQKFWSSTSGKKLQRIDDAFVSRFLGSNEGIAYQNAYDQARAEHEESEEAFKDFDSW